MLYHVHSYFSLRYGLLSPEYLVQWAQKQAEATNAPITLILADINTVSGACNFFKEAKKFPQVRAYVGVEFRNEDETMYVLIAQSQLGFAHINEYLSNAISQKISFPFLAPTLPDVFIIYPFNKVLGLSVKDLPKKALIGVTAKDIRRLNLSPWKKHPQKLLAYQRGTLLHSDDMQTHTLLRCIAHNCLLSKLKPFTTAGKHDMLFPLQELLQEFQHEDQLLRNAETFNATVPWCFEFNIPQNKKTFTTDPDEDYRMVRELAFEGLKYRYPKYTFSTMQRLEKELKLIYELGFTAYFLINWDLCRFARENHFFYVGRGSGANSMVAYCMRITDVDPIDLDLYFERFINPYRSSPPDFDLDFSWQDRDHVTAYILSKYGHDHTALLATYNTFQSNAVVRELGKVYGLPKAEIDTLLERSSYYAEAEFEQFTPPTDSIYSNPGMGHRIRNRSLTRNHNTEHPPKTSPENIYSEILKHAYKIHGLPNYRSIHVGGILISEKSIFHYSALDIPPKGFPTVQFSMLEAEDLGLAKFDILSQRGLGHIKDTVIYVRNNQGIEVDAHQIQTFKNDPRIARIIATGHTMGCFYVESPAMRQLLRKLQCKDYLTLVAASSVIRPGVARSGMMRTFIERHIDPKKREEGHPVLKEIMPETYGIMVYQEDVIRVAHEFAGLGLAESDVLRRGMSGKFRSKEEFQKVKSDFFTKAVDKNHPPNLVEEVWKQIESFAGYSFAKGHSASYAVESYQSLHLKAYYPLEFYTAVINNFGGFYRTEFYVHAARMCGADVQAPCINNSDILTRIDGKTLWLGLGLIQSLEQKVLESVLFARKNGPFTDLYDLKVRCEPGLEQLKILIMIGALRFTEKTRKTLLWEAHALFVEKKSKQPNPLLFLEKPKSYELPSLEDSWLEEAIDQRELLGFALCSPFNLVDPDDIPPSEIRCKHLTTLLGKSIYIEGYLVTVKPTRTFGGKEMNFGTWIDRDGYFFDTVHFPPSVARNPFKGRGVYRLWGVVTSDFGVFAIEIHKMEKLGVLLDPRAE
jgi:DNA polymerase-3 subunit alpha